ncbi:MAG: holo-ACP synthase [Anaerolineae bacterium]
MLTTGVDIVDIARIARAMDRWGARFSDRVYTPAERDHCRGRVAELAARFAAKEAISKALGTGMVGISWLEMEVLPDARGKPLVFLHGRALARAKALGLSEWSASLTHDGGLAIAFVVASDH